MSAERATPTIRLVGKPLAPPWRDSSKILARDLVLGAAGRARFRALGVRGADPGLPHAEITPLFRTAGGYGTSLGQQARLFLYLLGPERGVDLWQFFFAPSPRSSRAARLLLRRHGRASVQTVVSAPLDPRPGLFFGDRVVVLSETRKQELEALGLQDVRVIPPGIQDPGPIDDARIEAARQKLELGRRPLVLFAGDWEFGAGWEEMLQAFTAVRTSAPGSCLVLACRDKTAAAASHRDEARRRSVEQGWGDDLRLAGEVGDMPALLAAADVVALPARSLMAKSDLPLVLLEAMALGRPLVVSDRPELLELIDGGKAGVSVRADQPGELAAALTGLLGSPRRCEALGAAARERFLARHEMNRMAEQYLALYQELLAR